MIVLAALVAWPALAVPVGPDPSSLGPVDSKARQAAAHSLTADLQRIVAGARFHEARVGIHVVSLADGRELFNHDADALLNPASNMKLMTAAAALELLGPEFRFETEFWADAPVDENGLVKGNLYIKGKGDPTFVSERMFRVVSDLWNAGVRRITGDIYYDESYFDDVREGPGWEQEESDRAYIAPAGALSLNHNAVAIHVRPGPKPGAKAVVFVDPESDYFIIDNQVVTGSPRSHRRHSPSSAPEGLRQRIQVTGSQPVNRPGGVYYRRIDNPPLYFAQTFKTFLVRRGIKLGRTRFKAGVVPPRATLLVRSHSSRLSEVVLTMNKVSNNHYAEQVLKTLGAEVMGGPGSWSKGVAAVEHYLDKEVGIPRGAFVMRNGSGLNDTNRFSARHFTGLLAHMWGHFQVMPEFVTSLAVAGRDGTAQYRLDGTAAAGVLRAKTGTLENVAALSGYVGTATGEVLAFAIIVNDDPRAHRRILDGVDAVAARVAAYGRSPGVHLAAVVADAASAALTSTDLSARVRTYLELGGAGDPANVRFLRSALRTERDPLLRAVVAEAIYRSDADLGRGLLLENFEPGTELIARLRAVGVAAGAEATPVLTSLSAIGAEGHVDALARLLRSVDLIGGDPGLYQELAVSLVEVGRTAPRELVTALVHQLDAAEAALRLMATGLEGEDPEAHPFTLALRAAAEREKEHDGAGSRLAALQAAFDALIAPEEEAAEDDMAAASRPGQPTIPSGGLRPAAAGSEDEARVQPVKGGGG